MPKLIVFIVGFIAITMVQPANAHDWYHYEQTIDENQIGYTDVSVASGGDVRITTRFSNGKKIDGDHFLAWVVFYDKNSKIIATVLQARPVEPSYGGSSTEEVEHHILLMEPNDVADISSIGVHYQTFDKIDDKQKSESAFWSIFSAIIYFTYDSDDDYKKKGQSDWSAAAGIASVLFGADALIAPHLQTSYTDGEANRPTLENKLPKMAKASHPQCPGYPMPQLTSLPKGNGDQICTFNCEFHSGKITRVAKSCNGSREGLPNNSLPRGKIPVR